MDYWITAGDTPKQIIKNYTEATGRAPVMPKEYLGFWQCKLRYRTQEEVLSIARKYKEIGIHLDVIVIDFFHWPRQGDWCFDKEYWPDPKAMCKELHEMGTKVMVSIWPSVDKKCSHYYEMLDKGYLVRTEMGSNPYSRTQSLLKEFAQSTQSADIIILNKIYSSARENAADFKITGKTLYEETVKCNSKDKVFYYEESTDALDFVRSLIEEPVSSQYYRQKKQQVLIFLL